MIMIIMIHTGTPTYNILMIPGTKQHTGVEQTMRIIAEKKSKPTARGGVGGVSVGGVGWKAVS